LAEGTAHYVNVEIDRITDALGSQDILNSLYGPSVGKPPTIIPSAGALDPSFSMVDGRKLLGFIGAACGKGR
jgi:hypothetical protein